MVSSMERRSQDYGFESIDTMRDFFSRWIPHEEFDGLVHETEAHFRPRRDSSDEETQLQRLQKVEFAIDAGGTVRGVSPDLAWDLNAYGNQLISPWLYRQGASDEVATSSIQTGLGLASPGAQGECPSTL